VGVRVKSVLLIYIAVACAGAADWEQAQKLYDQTEYEESLKVLKAIPGKDARIYALMGQNYLMTGEYKKATEVLEKAVAAEPDDSDYVMWLARSYGRRAEVANPLSVMGLASKSRQYFERAVALDPGNIEALNDLLEFYLEAPGFLGGGMEKARSTVAQISRVNPAEGQWAQSQIDEKRKQPASAEAHLRRAVEMAPMQVGRLIDLARFLSKQGRFQEAEENFARAATIAPENAKLLFVRADAYIKSHRNLDVAKDLLKRYLSSNITPEDPPKSAARKLLQQIEGS
jgi:tetratricopeptide (TPR) repeat protein